MGRWIDRDDVRIALGPNRYVAYFDDDKDGIPETAGVDQVIMRAEQRFSRYAAEAFGSAWPPSSTGDYDGFRAIIIEYAIVIAEARVSAVSREDTEDRLEAIDEDLKDLARGRMTVDAAQPAGPQPSLATTEPAPPGHLSAVGVDFSNCGGASELDEWWRKEGCS